MARVTVEDCLARVPNRFALTILASRRARALSEGRGRSMVECDNKEGVQALREISAAKVRFKEDVDAAIVDFIEEQRRQLRVTAGEHTFLEAASLRALEEEDVEEEEEVGEIEELQTDPEALNKQAVVGEVDGEAETEDDAEFDEEAGFVDEELPEEAAEVEAPDVEGAAVADDEEEPEPEEED